MADTLRKELKRPDQFVQTGKRWLEWGVHHKSTLLAAAGGLLVVLVGIAGFFSYQDANERQANADLAAALTVMQAERWSEAASEMQAVADRWGGGVGGAARLYAAQAHMEVSDFDAAKAVLAAALEAGGLPSYLEQQARFNLAYVAEQQGDAGSADDLYAAASAASGPFRGPAILAEARLREAAGETEAAQGLYRRYLDEFPDAADRTTIEQRLSGL